MLNTLRSKISIGYFLILLLLVALGGYAIVSFASLADVTSSGLEQSAEQSLANSSMYESLVRIDQAELRMLAGDASNSSQVLAEEPAHFYQALQSAQRTASAQDSALQVLTQIEIRWQDFQSHLARFQTLARRTPEGARTYYEDTLSAEVDTLKSLNLALQEYNYQVFRDAKRHARERAKEATFGVMIVTLVAIGIGLVGSYLITRRAVRPLMDLTNSVKELQAGHLDARIPISGADEISDLGFEFNRLTERLQQFEAMNISEIVREKQKSEAIIESIDDPLLLFNAAGQLLLMNGSAEEITGITEQTALGRPLWQLFRDKRLLKDVERALEHAADTTRSSEASEEIFGASPPIVSIERRGRTRYFRLRVARIITRVEGDAAKDQEKPLVGVLLLFTDITHFKELDKMKSDFIAKVSHEFRTPLTSMTMSLDILSDELLGALNVEQHDIIDTSKQDARRLSKLIRDLLTLARLESTKVRAEAADEDFDIGSTVDQLIRSLTPLYQERHVQLTSEVTTNGRLHMSREHFVSVLSNLLSNALKHTPNGGEVKVDVGWDTQREEIILAVCDTGVGIAPEDQQRIFEKFVQLKHTDSATPGSVGLGLAIVREIAMRYNGSIELVSTPGKGSTFTVRLRAERTEDDSSHAARSVPSDEQSI